MNLFFDEDAQKIIMSAKKEMYELKHPYVGSEHLLLAILKNEELDITKMLSKYDITYKNFKDELISVVGIGNRSNEWFLFTPLLKRIINNATYSSKDNNINVSPYSLFISILQEGDGVANRILLGMNIDLDVLYEKFSSYNEIEINYTSNYLDSFGINMNKEYFENKYDPVVGRDREIDRIIQILLRKNKNNPILVGAAGVGKTAIVEEVVKRICCGEVPINLRDKVIYNISMANLVSGTKYRGEFEEKINKIIKTIKNNNKIILFIDEIHTLVGAGGAEGAIDASNILKPYLARGDIKVIGATTSDEYTKFIEGDKALVRRFQRVYIDEATIDEVRNIIDKLSPVYEDFHNVLINEKIKNLIIDLANKYITRGKQPDKTIDFLDEVCCYAAIKRNDNELFEYERKISLLENEKNKEILNHNFKKAKDIRIKEDKLKDEYNNKLVVVNQKNKKLLVIKDDVYDVLYNKTNILIGNKFLDKICNSKYQLKRNVYGQDEIIDFFIDNIKNQFKKQVLLIGKSGVGKTFLVDMISKIIFDEERVIKLDLSEYKSEYSISKIIGANPGYVGYKDKNSFVNKLKEKDFNVVLLENIDKCSYKILDLFLNAFDKGYFTSADGEEINISNSLFFLTSKKINNELGFVNTGDDINKDIFDDKFLILKLNSIKKKDIKKYIVNKIKQYHLLKENNINEIIDLIIEESEYKKYGFKKVDSLFEKYFLNSCVKS